MCVSAFYMFSDITKTQMSTNICASFVFVMNYLEKEHSGPYFLLNTLFQVFGFVVVAFAFELVDAESTFCTIFK